MALDPLLPIFAWPADWSQGISEALAFRTDALQARSGEAQTRALLLAPARRFDFALALSDRHRQRFGAQMRATRAGEWYLPILTDGVPLGVDLAAGLTSFALAGADRDFTDGGVVVFRDEESLDVEAFDLSYLPGSISNVGAPSARSWPASTMVYPARRARIDGNFSAAAFTGAHGYGRIRFALTEPSDWPAVAPVATYRGFPVLATRPHTGQDPDTEATILIESVEDGLGPAAVFDYVGAPLDRQAHAFWLNGRAAIAELRSVIYYLQGAQKSLWVPTWLDDLTIAANLGSGATALQVVNVGYTANLFEAVNRRDIRIELRSGAVHYRRVSAASVISPAIEQLTLSSALGVAITPADVLQISYLALCRSDSDLFQFDWWTGDFCEVAAAWRGRKHDL